MFRKLENPREQTEWRSSSCLIPMFSEQGSGQTIRKLAVVSSCKVILPILKVFQILYLINQSRIIFSWVFIHSVMNKEKLMDHFQNLEHLLLCRSLHFQTKVRIVNCHFPREPSSTAVHCVNGSVVRPIGHCDVPVAFS